MTTNGSMPPVDAWQVESMRVTAFPGEAVTAERLPWWDRVVEFPPDTVVSRPKLGRYQAQGDLEGRRLALQIQPGRVEWALSPVVKAEEDDLPSLGSFSEVLTILSRVVVSWLPLAPELKRLAFGAVLIQPVDNIHTGYVLIQSYLSSMRLGLAGPVSDFLLQINRPRSSRTHIEGLRINRLMRWSVQVAQRVTVTLGPSGVAGRTLGEEAACRLELDINTAPDFGAMLPREQLAALLQEMIDLGEEIAQKGDAQ